MNTPSRHKHVGVLSLALFAVLSGTAAGAEADPATIKRLVRQLKSSRTRPAAVRELAKMGKPAVDGIADALADKTSGVYTTQAKSALVAMGPGAIEHITGMLKYRNATVRKVGLQVLGEFGPLAGQAVPSIMKVLEAPDPTAMMGLRTVAAQTLGKIGPPAAPAAALLVQAMTDRADVHGFLREAAIAALGQLGPGAAEASADLAKIVLDKSQTPKARIAATQALGRVGAPADLVVTTLRQAMQDAPNTMIAREAVEGLARLGPKAKNAIPDIITALDTKAVGYRGLQALARMGGDAVGALDELTRRLASEDVRHRMYSAEALGLIGPKAKTALKPLVAAFKPLKASDPSRVAIVVAIARIEGYPSRAVGFLQTCIKSPTPEVASAAFQALGELGEQSRGALPALVMMAEGTDTEPGGKAWQAIEALGNMGLVSQQVAPYLIKIVKARKESKRHPTKPIRLAAIAALAKIAPKDYEVRELLQAAADSDPNPTVRKLAMKTLATLTRKDKSTSK